MPAEKMSVLWSSCSPRDCSKDMNDCEPVAAKPGSATPAVSGFEKGIGFAIPKSAIFTTPSFEIRILEGFMSR